MPDLPTIPVPFEAIESTAHVIQVALTPVFLLSGIGGLLAVFATRLARVADRVDLLSEKVESADAAAMARLTAQLAHLRRRSHTLDIAVVLATLAGGATCAATITLFVGALRHGVAQSALYVLLGIALACIFLALCAFLCEMLLASRGIRDKVMGAPDRRAVAEAGAAMLDDGSPAP